MQILPSNVLGENGNIANESTAKYGGKACGSVYFALPSVKEQLLDIAPGHSNVSGTPAGPIPLSSVSLRLVSVSESSKEKSLASEGSNKDATVFALRHSCLKRQLCGRILFFSSRDETAHVDTHKVISSTTELTLPHFSGGGNYSRVSYCVVDVTPMKSVGAGSHIYDPTATRARAKGLFFIVLPSTQIHLLERDDNHLDTQEKDRSILLQETLRSSCHKSEFTSPATRVLEDAIRIVLSPRSSSRGVDVPRAFLLSGPPGVGKVCLL